MYLGSWAYVPGNGVLKAMLETGGRVYTRISRLVLVVSRAFRAQIND
jgi:hypothetical protein